MLLDRQVNGVWQCRAHSLIDPYEEALQYVRVLRNRGSQVRLRHVYREYHSEADGLANLVIDGDQDRISETWAF